MTEGMSNLIARTRVWSMPGGIHPVEHKSESNSTPIEAVPLPSMVWLPLNMHIGAPATPVVTVGATVRKGQIIAQAASGISATVHAPTSGRVVAIEDHPYAHESGFRQPAIAIETDGQDTWRRQTPWHDWQQKTPEDILQRIHDGGIAGMGGAGFPTVVKYRNRHAATHTLLVNAAECEPYITADDRLMRERAEDILQGARICQHLLDARTLIIGIEDNKPDAIAALEQAAQTLNLPIRMAVVPTRYPSGGEKQLIQLVTGQEVPHGGLPSDLGIVCQNVGTLYQVCRTVIHDEPSLSRITTVTGAAVDRPGNYEVLIGTSIETLLNHAGAHLKKADRVIMGGPMMGFAVPDITAPVIKTTNCLLVPTRKELPPPMEDNPCIRCGLCEQACPADLLPQQMLWASRNRELHSAELHSLEDCIECGACAYVCPSRIPLVQYFRYAKGELKQERQQHEESERARIRFENRQARLDREKQEKEARRKARAEAAAKALAEKKAKAGNDGKPAAENPDDPVKAAMARAAAKKEARANESADTSPEALKQAADKAKVKYEKAAARLKEAEENGSDLVAALSKAARKLEEKYRSADAAYRAAADKQENAEQ